MRRIALGGALLAALAPVFSEKRARFRCCSSAPSTAHRCRLGLRCCLARGEYGLGQDDRLAAVALAKDEGAVGHEPPDLADRAPEGFCCLLDGEEGTGSHGEAFSGPTKGQMGTKQR